MSVLLQINNLSKSFGTQVIFDCATVVIGDKQKIGVIGRNGAGKSTLFKIIVEEIEKEEGEIIVGERTRIGYLEQQENFLENETVMDFLIRSSGKEKWRCAQVAGKFYLKGEKLDMRVTDLSGGYQMRVKLSAMLLMDPNLLLLDEPTNYLDLSTLILLEEFLRSYNGSYLIISHDREFLKNTCDETMEIENGKIFLYPRPLEEYFIFKAEKIESDIKYNKKIERQKKHLQTFVDRFRYKASKATQAQSKIKQIERLEMIDIPEALRSVNIYIPNKETRKGLALRVEDMSIGYGTSIVADDISFDIERGEHIAVLGDNGQGKTTFLKTIAGELPAISGKYTWKHEIKVAYYAQHVPEMLNDNERVEDYLTSKALANLTNEDILRMAGNFLFSGDDVKKKISGLSGGERARLCLAGMLLGDNNVLLLDEPTNHLDFETVEALASALDECNITVIFISHNREFIKRLATGIIEVGGGKIKRYLHNYEEYIYHLTQKEKDDVGDDRKGSSGEGGEENKEKRSKEEQRIIYEELKKVKKELKKAEEKMQKLEKEKNEIIKEFDKDPVNYSEEKAKRLGEVEREMREHEEAWLALQEKIENINQ